MNQEKQVLRTAITLVALAVLVATPTRASSLRFYGSGVGDIDRVKIRIDDPALPDDPGPPVDVGAQDFTLEFWVRGFLAENTAPAVTCDSSNGWIYGNIVIDRDRFNQGRNYGVSFGDGRLAFGTMGPGGYARTICGSSNVLDGAWHHIALQRRRSDGYLWMYVDGALEAEGDGPDGDISYPDDGVPGNYCGGPCVQSDPFVVLAAEKHDAGGEFPSFAGWLDEIRYSNTLRYSSAFVPPSAPFVTDASTVGLYHLDEGSGDIIGDASGATGGPSDGVRRFGSAGAGSASGPEWSSQTPFSPTTTPAAPHRPALEVHPNPARGPVTVRLRAETLSDLGPIWVSIFDLAGRRVARLPFSNGTARWPGPGSPLPAAGSYLAKIELPDGPRSARFQIRP